jgi:glutaconyl-CoA/methylmalonyl-CoA decarboxylase subunit gamma
MRRYRVEIRGKDFVIDVEEFAADRFAVTVGNQSYEVTLAGDEDLPGATITPGIAPTHGGAAARQASPSARIAARAEESTAAPADTSGAAPRRPASGGAGTLNAPMPGVIVELSVGPGDTVQRGQTIAILDAMKMQNNIKSPRAGTIAEVYVAVGQAVGHGEPMVRFREA